MFEGFRPIDTETSEVRIHAQLGGQGRPVLLLHGYPETHVMWRRVALALAERFAVVAPDLRGYGASGKPHGDDSHLAYSKRRMGRDMFELMSSLGHERFAVAGHDRGARVAYRMALDQPERVERLAVLDIVPTLSTWESMDAARSLSSFHWSLLAQPAPLPERLIGADPDHWLQTVLTRWAGNAACFEPEALLEYRAAFRDPATIHATCEDYRAGAGIDPELDRADRSAGRRIAAPLMVLWGNRGKPADAASYLEVWQQWADDVRGFGLDCGHFIAEEQPHRTAELLAAFFAGSA